MRQVDKTGFARYQYTPNPKNSKHLLNSAANTAGSWKLTILSFVKAVTCPSSRGGEKESYVGGVRRDLSNSFYRDLNQHVPVKKTLKFDDLQYCWPISAATIEGLRRQRRQRLYDRAAGDGRSVQCSAATGVDRTRMASDNPNSPDARKYPCSSACNR